MCGPCTRWYVRRYYCRYFIFLGIACGLLLASAKAANTYLQCSIPLILPLNLEVEVPLIGPMHVRLSQPFLMQEILRAVRQGCTEVETI